MSSVAVQSGIYQSPLYNRRIRLELTPYQSPYSRAYGTLGDDATPLRIAFSITRTLEGKSDKAKITITNMTEANRNALVKDSRVVLTAGYDNKTGTLFQGLVSKLKSQQSGPDINTELECEDGYINVQFATVRRVYTESVTLAQVIQDLASDLSLTIDGTVASIAPGVIKGLPNQTFPRGLTLDGPVSRWLDLYLRAQAIDWTIQGGRLNIVPKYTTSNVQPCVYLSQSTGMIEAPAFSEKGLVVASLLNADILPGRLLQVTSKNASVGGFYKALECQYDGDTHDLPWRVTSVCEAVPTDAPALPLALPGNFQKAVV